jgi:hypothetical protein
MAIPEILDECNAKLREAMEQQLKAEEEDRILTRIDNTLQMMACLREKVTASQQKREEEDAKAKVSKWLDGRVRRSTPVHKRVVTVKSNLNHIFLTKHIIYPTVKIAEDLKASSTHDPGFVMGFAYYIYSGDWINGSMAYEKYGVVKELLMKWFNSSSIPFEEEFEAELEELLEELSAGKLQGPPESEFAIFHSSHPNLIFTQHELTRNARSHEKSTRCERQATRCKATSNVVFAARRTGTCTSTTRCKATDNVAFTTRRTSTCTSTIRCKAT